MHNDTPLGATMHLMEIDRQAGPKLHRPPAMRQDASPVTRIRAAMIAVMQRLDAVGIPGRTATRGQSHT